MKAPTRRSQTRKKAVRAAPRKRKGAAAEEAKSELCVNCAHRDGCGFRGAAPVLQCEEYRCEGPGCAEVRAVKAKPASSASRSVQEPPDLKGLCVNCDNRFDCGFPRLQGGVWHCQEYR